MVELDHTEIVSLAEIQKDKHSCSTRSFLFQIENIFADADAHTLVLLALHGAQPLLGFPQYTIMSKQAYALKPSATGMDWRTVLR